MLYLRLKNYRLATLLFIFVSYLLFSTLPATALSTSTEDLPLISIAALELQGGFRLPTSRFGDDEYAIHSYSPGVIAYNPENESLYTVSHDYHQGIGEFAIPTVVAGTNVADYATATLLQNFRGFHTDGQPPTGIDSNFRVTGMALVDNKLVVNYINWYDGAGSETDTSVVFQDPTNLADSAIVGPFQLGGAAHAAGWFTPIPTEWQAELGGDFIAGHAHGSINSRLSIGPPAHVLTASDLTSAASGGPVATTPVLDFNISNPLYDKNMYDSSTTTFKAILYNHDLRNRLWTEISGAAYGFIVPGTGTYMTLGFAGGFHSGIGYKITQNNGNLCGGPCSYDANDNYNHYWLWKVSDLVKVKRGEMVASEVRPYEYGKLDTVNNLARLKGAAYDAQNQRLFVSLQAGDTLQQYNKSPLILVYSLDPTVVAPPVTESDDQCFVIKNSKQKTAVVCL